MVIVGQVVRWRTVGGHAGRGKKSQKKISRQMALRAAARAIKEARYREGNLKWQRRRKEGSVL